MVTSCKANSLLASTSYSDHATHILATGRHLRVEKFDIMDELVPHTQTTYRTLITQALQAKNIICREVTRTSLYNIFSPTNYPFLSEMESVAVAFVVKLMLKESYPAIEIYTRLQQEITHDSEALVVTQADRKLMLSGVKTQAHEAVCRCQFYEVVVATRINPLTTLVKCRGRNCRLGWLHRFCMSATERLRHEQNLLCDECVTGNLPNLGLSSNALVKLNITTET